MNKQRRATIEMLICAALWSIAGALIKLIPWNPFAISGMRSLVASIVIFAYIKGKKLPVIINRQTLFSGFAMFLTYTSFIGANKLTTAANAIVLQFTAPLFIMIFGAVFQKERFKRADVFAVLLTICGISLFFLDQLTPGKAAGNMLAICAGACMAVMFITVGKAGDDERMSCILLAQLITALVGIPVAVATRIELSPTSVLAVAVLGVFQLGIPYILFARAIKYCPPLACSLLGALEPLLNPVWVVLLTGERPGLYALLGGAVVVVTVTWWSIHNDRTQRGKSEAALL